MSNVLYVTTSKNKGWVRIIRGYNGLSLCITDPLSGYGLGSDRNLARTVLRAELLLFNVDHIGRGNG